MILASFLSSGTLGGLHIGSHRGSHNLSSEVFVPVKAKLCNVLLFFLFPVELSVL